MADVIDYEIVGEDLQGVIIELDSGEGVQAEAGAMLYMEDGIEMQTSTQGGLLKGFKRMITGESFFITTFAHHGKGKSHVAFAAPYPGRIVPIDLTQFGGGFICQKDSFLCSASGIDISIAFTKKIGAGLFGGEGFILQKLQGDGLAFVHAGGMVLEKDLAAGQSLRIDTGCIVGFQPTVTYDIKFVGGFKNALFGGEGLFYALLTGPGRVYLQTLPFSRLADRIGAAARFGGRREQATGIAGLGGGLLGGILGGSGE